MKNLFALAGLYVRAASDIAWTINESLYNDEIHEAIVTAAQEVKSAFDDSGLAEAITNYVTTSELRAERAAAFIEKVTADVFDILEIPEVEDEKKEKKKTATNW